MAAPDLTALDVHHHEVLATLRRQGPVVWVDAIGGWIVLSRDLAVAVMRDPDTFTVDDPRFATAQLIGRSMLSTDGDEHRRHRDPFGSAFRPSDVIARDSVRIAEMARGLVESLQPQGRGELRRQLAGPLAVAVASGALGLEDHPPEVMLGWYDLIVGGVNDLSRGKPVAPSARDAFDSLAAALSAVAARRGSALAELAEVLTEADLVSNAAVFLFGGIETCEGMTANALYHLLRDPEQFALVRTDRALIDAAVEESLRLEPAAARVDRYATRDIELAGRHIRAGDFVAVSLAAANRDPEHFVEPDRFDARRVNARNHVAFAHGPHVCLGSTFARLQTRAAIESVVDLLSDVRLAAPVTTGGVVFRKPLAVHVEWSV